MKFILNKPKKSEILIYDRHSKNFAGILFKKRKYEIIDVRYESINLYVLLLSLLKFNLFKIRNIYKKIYFEIVSPKIIYTSIDNNPGFFKLKHLYKKGMFISDQNGMRNKKFYNLCKNYNDSSKNKLIADYIFSLGLTEKERVKSIIKGNYFALGNTKNNSFKSKSLSDKNIKRITFISGSENTLLNNPPDDEKIVFKNLISYCSKKKLSLYFLERPNDVGEKSINERKKYYQERFNSKKWNFIPSNKQYKKNYKIFNYKSLFVFIDSTLGYEALSRGKKVVTIQTSFPFRDYPIKYPKSGFFWSNKLNYSNLEKILNRVFKISNNKWNKIAKKYSNNLVCFDRNNRTKLNIINKILKS